VTARAAWVIGQIDSGRRDFHLLQVFPPPPRGAGGLTAAFEQAARSTPPDAAMRRALTALTARNWTPGRAASASTKSSYRRLRRRRKALGLVLD
jgi:hypothetical protein